MNRTAVLFLASFLVHTQPASASSLAPEEARHVAQGAVAEILDALALRDFKRLAKFVGKERLAVSPYVMLEGGTLRLSRAEVANCARDKRVRFWGLLDGSADPIRATCRRYFDDFVWEADYRKADEVLYNEPRQRGNDINNNHEFAPDGIVVELHIHGKGIAHELTWSSLRLIFRKGGKGLSLIAITRDVWTI